MNTEIYKSLFEESYSVMFIIHPETGRIIDVNKAACKYYGYQKQSLQNMRIQEINTLTEEQIFAEMKDARDKDRNYFNFKHRLANGEIRDVEVFSGPIVINEEKVLYSIVHDITKRKEMERQIAVERQFIDSLINSLPGVMYVVDQLGRFRHWNKNFETVTGYSAAQISIMTPLDLIVFDDRDHLKKTIDTVFREGKADVEARFLRIDGETIPYLLTGYKFTQNDLNYLVGVGVDISGRVKAEKEKERLIKKLQRSLSQVNQLSGLLPICASCKNIRDDKGYWNQIENYLKDHSEVEFSHSLCPNCAKKLYPDFFTEDYKFQDKPEEDK